MTGAWLPTYPAPTDAAPVNRRLAPTDSFGKRSAANRHHARLEIQRHGEARPTANWSSAGRKKDVDNFARKLLFPLPVWMAPIASIAEEHDTDACASRRRSGTSRGTNQNF